MHDAHQKLELHCTLVLRAVRLFAAPRRQMSFQEVQSYRL